MNALLTPFLELVDIVSIREGLRKGNAAYQLGGCPDELKPLVSYALAEEKKYKLIVSADEIKAKAIYDQYRSLDENVLYFPAKDMLFYQSDIRGNALTRERMRAISEVLYANSFTIVTTMDALMNKLPSRESFEDNICFISDTDEIDLEELRHKLFNLGYEHVGQVDHPGEYSIRGGIIDIFPLTSENPVRIELFGDEIDSIRVFSTESQKSFDKLKDVIILPAVELSLSENEVEDGLNKIEKDVEEAYRKYREALETEKAYNLKSYVDRVIEDVRIFGVTQELESFLPYFCDAPKSFVDFLPKNTCVILDEPTRVISAAQALELEFSVSMMRRVEGGFLLSKQADMLFSCQEVLARLSKMSRVLISVLDYRGSDIKCEKSCSLTASSVNSYNGSYDLLVKDLNKYKKKKYRILLATDSATKGRRMAEELIEDGFTAFFSENMDEEIQKGVIMIVKSSLTRGFEFTDCGFVLLTNNDIFGQVRKKKKKLKRFEPGQAIDAFSDLHVGDYVVHETHGLGIYRGMEQMEYNHVIKDYLKIEYAKGANLYVLSNSLDAISKYSGPDGKKPKLNTLGSQEWSKTKAKVQQAVTVVAKELVELYAARQQKEGFVYGEDTVWQKEFEEAFPYEETEGQIAAIEAVKSDMMSAKIMDRLICGDVGYGKTEIAIRAAFKAVQENKQVVYLVPTTILAQQHYNTFVQRMGQYPVRIELMCRFRTAAQQKKTIEGLKNGSVDIVIGTHRLLSKDMGYNNLGLLIIDEEQRFGVTHKEKIKQLKNTVDVLTLSATPIPRTLHMSLVGIRDMSLLEEAPMERMPIQTFVFEYNQEMVREAVTREMARGGQVFYVFNRVAGIAELAMQLQELLPEATVAYAHGKMNETQLEDIMLSFINHEIDVLVSTTIIEIGLDISNANTIIIHDADNLGLSQLYQLRGRVGRSNRTAYAFLMYRRDKMLKETAEKRLEAIKEFTDLGSGFKIAMRDLEIRGAGNVLGEAQHGHMAQVGYDMYCKMLSTAVAQEKGEKTQEEFTTTVDLDIEAYIPPGYIVTEEQRIDIYKRIALITSEEEKDEMLEELIDRFGEPRKSVMSLLDVAMLRVKAHKAYITSIEEKEGNIKIEMYEKAPVNVVKLQPFINKYNPVITFLPDPKAPAFVYHTLINSSHRGKARISYMENFMEDLLTIIDES